MRPLSLIGGLTAALVLSVSQASAQSPAHPGEKLFQDRCGICHSMTPAPGKMGPPLANIVGKKMGSAPGYAYSSGMTKAGRVWTRAELDGFLATPAKQVPGTKMMVGVANAEQRKAIVDYLAVKR